MHIYVDADACPVTRIVERIAKEFHIGVTLLCDTNHVLASDYSEVKVIGAGSDAVDFALIGMLKKGDVVVTQDYGVAAMALGKGAYAIHQSGKWYTNENIDLMLMERHLNKKARRASGKHHLKGPRKRSNEDNESFASAFTRLLEKALGESDPSPEAVKAARVKVFEDTMEWIQSDGYLSNAVKNSCEKTEIFWNDDYPVFDKSQVKDQKIVVTKDRSYQAAMRLAKEYPGKRIAVMNFANARVPGGGVKKGAGAQEECLCRCSTLYPVISTYDVTGAFYKYHKKLIEKVGTDKASDTMMYSEDIVIVKTDVDMPERMDKADWVCVDVMTVAAPDLRKKKNPKAKVSADGAFMNNAELFAYHVKRAIHMLTVAASKGAEVLVLGAFGCGAFKNDPEVVARAYRVALEEFPKVFEKVEFAVYCGPEDETNYQVFGKVFGA